jgi:DNA gyrase/topoisomerase IV subunit B
VTSGEFRTLVGELRGDQRIVRAMRKGPIEVRVSDGSKAPAERSGRSRKSAELTRRRKRRARRDRPAPTHAAAARPPREERARRVRTIDEFIDHFIALGRKGVAINRYKGLGEMNPETLWTTTMNPEIRTLLQVRAEDHTEADSMFTTLMGDQVEPRRKFIEDNALEVKNLDI